MSFQKNDRSKPSGYNNNSSELSEKSGLFLTSRHVSWLVSSIVMICFFTFIAGYFLGKKKAVEKFYSKIKQDSFADHIYYSMCSMYDKADELQGEDGGNMQTEVATLSAESTEKKEKIIVSNLPEKQENLKEKKESVVQVAQELDIKSDNKYYAELIGFGTERAAQRFANKLLKDNISVSVKRRRSKSPRGRVIYWYQVITEKFSDRNDLIALVDDISVQERLKDVRIVSC